MVDAFLLIRGSKGLLQNALKIAEPYTIRSPIYVSESDSGIFVRCPSIDDLASLRREISAAGVKIPEYYIEPPEGVSTSKSGDALLGRAVVNLNQLAVQLDPGLEVQFRPDDVRLLEKGDVEKIGNQLLELRFDWVVDRLSSSRLRRAAFGARDEDFGGLANSTELLFTSLSKAYKRSTEVSAAILELARVFHSLDPRSKDSEYSSSFERKTSFVSLLSELEGAMFVREQLLDAARREGFGRSFEADLRGGIIERRRP